VSGLGEQYADHTVVGKGHENMGIVEEVGAGVTLLSKGDRVVMPFNVADGRCRNCEEGKTAFCTGVNPGFAGGAYGYVAMGPYRGKSTNLPPALLRLVEIARSWGC
jgi:threonine dehydrogenase-like Zn-dependent dehydrogenase